MAFLSCYSFTSVTSTTFPVCTIIGSSAFFIYSFLTSVNFPACETIDMDAFYSCSFLTTASFPVCTNIGRNAFRNCVRLISLYLDKTTSVCQLLQRDALTGTPIGGDSTFAGCYGSVYVPQSLLASYQTATNWVYFSKRFVGV